MATFKKLVESSLSRVWSQVTTHESGTISAFRYATSCGDGEVFSKDENLTRTNTLKAKLLKLGYGVTAIDGTYIENFGQDNAKDVKEKSFLVVDLKDTGKLKEDLIKLGQEFDQDSITFSKPSGEYYLISTNRCPSGYPGNGKVGVEIKLGKPIFGKQGEFHSKVNGRPFVFESLGDNLVTIRDLSISEIRSVDALSKKIIKDKDVL